MKTYLTLITALLLVCACNPFNPIDPDNQFTLKDNNLYFTQRLLCSWETGVTRPVCLHCSKNVYAKQSPGGQMLFRQINDESGDLVVFYANKVQHSFALNTGETQYSVQLKTVNKQLQISINGDQIKLQEKDKIVLRLGAKEYFILLQKLQFISESDPKFSPKQLNYFADILIWVKT